MFWCQGNMRPWPEVCSQLNSLLRGWSAYFCYGTRKRAYRAIDHHVCGRVRHFLSRRHKMPSREAKRFPSDLIFGDLGVLPLDYRRGPYNQTSRKAGCGKSAVRFNERGWETGSRHFAQATAPILDSTRRSVVGGKPSVRFRTRAAKPLFTEASRNQNIDA
jgi:hypothetical protein